MDENILPVEPETPEPPMPVLSDSKPEESPTKLAELANNLFEAATKMQRDAEALMKAIEADEAPLEEEAPAEKMTPEESETASKAILGL